MSTRLKCYLSVPAGYDLSKIELVLNKLGIDHHSFYDFSIGTTFSDLIRRKIRESDFVITILDGENPNIIYELGVAEGLKKPVFVILDKNYKPPYFLSGQIYLQTDTQNLSQVQLAVANFVQDLNIKNKKSQNRETDSTLSVEEANELLIRISKLRKQPNEREIVNVIQDLFKSIGVQVEATLGPTERGMDLIIRSKRLAPYFGDMILVEVKGGALQGRSIDSAQQQLMHAITNSVAYSGLVLYLDSHEQRYSSTLPNILCFDLEDFVNGVASYGFEKLLIQTRNNLAHGRI